MKKNAGMTLVLLLAFLVFSPSMAAAQFLSFAEGEKREWRVDDEERARRAAAKMKTRTEYSGDKKEREERFDSSGNKIYSERFENYNGTENVERVTYRYNDRSSVEVEARESLSKEPNGRTFGYKETLEYIYGPHNTLSEVRKVSESAFAGGKSLYRYSTRYEYDENKNIVSKTKYIFDEQAGQEKIDSRYTYSYDEHGYCVSQVLIRQGTAGLTKEVEIFENQYYSKSLTAETALENKAPVKPAGKAGLRSRVISRSGIRERAVTVSENGRYLEQIFYKPDGSLKRRTVFDYDSAENLISEIEYDDNNRIDNKCVYKYDEKNRIVEEVNFNAGGKVASRTVCSYDSEGNKTKTSVSYSPEGRESKKAVWRFNKFGYTIDFSRYDAFEKKKNITRFEYEYF